MISGIGKVVLPVDDQERAKEFWTTRMGFEMRRDESYRDERWIEVSPPDGAPLLVLSPRPAGEPRREVPDELPYSPVFFDCADIEATHRELSERGVRFPMPPARRHFGWWSLFEDPDGTRYALGEWGRTPTAFAAPPPDPELERLEPLLGTWRSGGHTQDSVLGPGVPVRSTETFYWLEGGHFLVSSYETTFGSEPTQTGVNYWSYDADAKRFRVIFFSNNGPFSEDGNRYQGEVAGGRLTFEGPARFQYELGNEGTIAVNPDGTISVAGGCVTTTATGRPGCTTPSGESGRPDDRAASAGEQLAPWLVVAIWTVAMVAAVPVIARVLGDAPTTKSPREEKNDGDSDLEGRQPHRL